MTTSRYITFSLAIALAGAAGGQDRIAPVAQNLTTTEECRRCHFTRPGEPPQFGMKDGFCEEVEATIWTEQDKHRQSLYLLVEGAGRELTNRILGFDLREILVIEPAANPQGKKAAELLAGVAFRPDIAPGDERLVIARACVACHAPVAEPRIAGGGTTLEYGVSCQACHGPARFYLDPHKEITRKVWRVVKPEAKEQLFGLRDLRNPVKRAELCSSCHVGSFADEWKADPADPPRFVKHEWYAKGHPPLPSLEFATFARYMPAHWRRIQEKPLTANAFAHCVDGPAADAIDRFVEDLPMRVVKDRDVQTLKAELFAASYLSANRGSFPSEEPQVVAADRARTRDVLVSGATVLAAYADLLRKTPVELQRDFALFDCGACHHELRSRFPTDARVRRQLAPGRPPPAFWTQAIVRQGAGLDETPANALDADFLALDQAFSRRPLGDWEAIPPAAEKLATDCRTLARSLVTLRLDDKTAGSLLDEFVLIADDEDRDYHAARQLAWAIRELLRDHLRIPYGDNDSPGARSIDELFGGGPWKGPLRLQLPAGQEQTVTLNLSESLAAISKYDPAAFRAVLDKLKAGPGFAPKSP